MKKEKWKKERNEQKIWRTKKILQDIRESRVVGHIAGREHERRVLFVHGGQLSLQRRVKVRGAADVARAARASAAALREERREERGRMGRGAMERGKREGREERQRGQRKAYRA